MKEERLNRMPTHCVVYLDCVPVSVFVLPLFVAPVMAAWGGRGGSLLRLWVLERRVHVFCVLLARLILLILKIWRGVAFRAAACLTWRDTNSVSESTTDHEGETSKLLCLRKVTKSAHVFHSCDPVSHRVHILPANQNRECHEANEKLIPK